MVRAAKLCAALFLAMGIILVALKAAQVIMVITAVVIIAGLIFWLA